MASRVVLPGKPPHALPGAALGCLLAARRLGPIPACSSPSDPDSGPAPAPPASAASAAAAAALVQALRWDRPRPAPGGARSRSAWETRDGDPTAARRDLLSFCSRWVHVSSGVLGRPTGSGEERRECPWRGARWQRGREASREQCSVWGAAGMLRVWAEGVGMKSACYLGAGASWSLRTVVGPPILPPQINTQGMQVGRRGCLHLGWGANHLLTERRGLLRRHGRQRPK